MYNDEYAVKKSTAVGLDRFVPTGYNLEAIIEDQIKCKSKELEELKELQQLLADDPKLKRAIELMHNRHL